MRLNEYITLGRSGLRVSPLTLGTMTFGTEWGWGSEENVSRSVFDGYIDAGGNLVDTADAYTGGKSEELVGKFIADRNLRDRVVLATKFTFNNDPGNPNGGGNGRKNIYRALAGSLRRLHTDYIDLYWLHAWDTVTPVEEVVSTLNDLVREGKILHYGFSDTPAWYVARAYTLAEKEGKDHVAALQLEYSLVERNIEREHIPVAQELGLAVCPWSPIAGGFLAGKYRREGNSGRGEGRLEQTKDHPVLGKVLRSDENWRIADTVVDVAKAIGKTPAQVALNWVTTRPGVTSTIIGATKLAQLEDNFRALEFTLPAELRQQLDEVSALPSAHPYLFFGGVLQAMIRGNVPIQPWRRAHATGASEPTVASAKTAAAD